MGGSGSTGSSLLQRMLGRHPRIVAGPEVGLFQFPVLFEEAEWTRRRMGLLHENFWGVKSRAFARRNGAKLLLDFYQNDPAELRDRLKNSSSLPVFADQFFEKKLREKNATHWVEKTPQNAQGFAAFLRSVPGGRVIHCLRDPYETMTSLVRRGHSEWVAAGHFVYQTCCALSVRDDPRHHEIRYADLVQRTEPTLQTLCAFLGVNYAGEMLDPTAAERREAVQMDGWKAAETDPVRRVNLRKFDTLEEVNQQRISAALATYRIPRAYAERWAIPYRSFAEICAVLNYRQRPVDPRPFHQLLRRQRRADWWIRTRRLHPTGWGNYPGEMKFG